MAGEEQKNLYNQVTLHNFSEEDFIFSVDNVPYIIKAGEKRNFPKFMASLATKHFVDRELIRANPDGKLLLNQNKRTEVAGKFVIGEEKYEQPRVPTRAEIIKDMNRPSDLEAALNKNEPKPTMIPTPEVTAPPVTANSAAGVPAPEVTVTSDTSGVPAPNIEYKVDNTAGVATVPEPENETTTGVPTPSQMTKAKDEEKFDQVEDEKNAPLPARKEMMAYAKDTLKLDLSNDKITKRLDKLSDKELYDELQMGV